MPIIDVQRRLREVGRIRLGEQVETPQGRKRPVKLTKFRLTSRDRSVIEAAAELWGGEARPWDAPDGQQWEVYTDADSVPVIVPPTEMAFSQWYEQWSAGGCQVRCDGRWDQQRDVACTCDPEERECSMTTRLSVILDDIPGLGVWRVESHGYYAAVELGGAVDVCQMYAGAGRMLPARLRLEQRKTTKTLRSGKVETYRYAVPVLDVDVQMSHLMALAAGGPGGALPAGTPVAIGGPSVAELAAGAAEGPSFTPAPEGAPPPSLADQFDAVDNPAARTRVNAAARLPETGAKPRTVEEAPPPPAAPPSSGGAPSCADCGGSLAGAIVGVRPGGAKFHKGGCPTGGAAAPPVLTAEEDEAVLAGQANAAPTHLDPRDDPDRQRRRFHAIANKRWPGDNDVREAARHAWLEEHYGVKSLNDLSAQQIAKAADVLDAEVEFLTADPAELEGEPFPDAIDATTVEEQPAEEAPPPAPPVPATPPPPAAGATDDLDYMSWDEEGWRAFLAAHGVKPIPFVREAASIADEVGEGKVEHLADIVGKLSLGGLMASWVLEKAGKT